ncbi:MAG: matrixin family metalloprotease [bacterium]|nr:matrixin family metalloprotease [bacterium]
MISKIFSWIFLIAAISLAGYVWLGQKDPCEVPIEYKIGSFDTRFNISKTDFLREVERSTYIWENEIGKNLFEYDAGLEKENKFKKYLDKYVGRYFIRQAIVINLIYDDRQKMSEENRLLVAKIDDTKMSADAVKREFRALQDEYGGASAEYQSMLSEYKKKRRDYQALEAKRLEVNGLADAINALVKKYNYLVTSVNDTVQTINQTAGREFEEGQYVRDTSGERINIYEFANRNVLMRVLAHEFGHALGLDHNENPDSIMYYLNHSKNIKPTKEDLVGLREVCGI